MKKTIWIILIIVIVILTAITYGYYQYKSQLIAIKKQNEEYEKYTVNQILGSSLMTLINKTIDYNERNEIKKDDKNSYIENDKNSIKIDIKFLESENIFSMEAIANLGSENFIKNYTNMSFKCTQIQYHKKTGQIKYLLFEQV